MGKGQRTGFEDVAEFSQRAALQGDFKTALSSVMDNVHSSSIGASNVQRRFSEIDPPETA